MSRTRITVVLLGLTLAAGQAAAAEPPKEVATAAFHAGLAAGSKDLKMVHAHLHHTINCLVGPGGAGFDANELNPCKDQGKGALPAATDPGQRKHITEALDYAGAGLKTMDLAAAQKAATEARDELKEIK
jgi:hypothetical protein